jgi:hypothetical protein
MPVKERDLAEDWDLDPVTLSSVISKMKPLGPDALRVSTGAELEEIARELLAGQ